MSSELNPGMAPESGQAEPDYISYSGMLQRLAVQFPDVPLATIESIARDEHEVISDGVPYMVPRLVEIGTLERLESLGGDQGR